MYHIRPTAADMRAMQASGQRISVLYVTRTQLLRLAIALFCNAQNSTFPVNLS